MHQIDVQGALNESGELGRRVESALAGGVRWLILDLAEAFDVTDPVLAALVDFAAALRARKGELIVAGAAAVGPSGSGPTTSPTARPSPPTSTRP